jgi:NADH:ubiquinone oxidoreductase subunit F (NADH-binding)
MTLVHRVLSPHPIESLDEYLARGGGVGLEAARQMEPDAIIAELTASGLRGRGGAGFPTGVKWRTVRDDRSPDLPTTVVVNAAEGEPGTFKDRTILLNDPYTVIEGALVAARAMDATEVVIATKAAFPDVVTRLRAAIAEVELAKIAGGVTITVFEGPREYLYGEETALLEAIDGRMPFPRITPPYRRGVVEVAEHADDVDTGSNLSSHLELAGPGGETEAPPALVDNVETMANVPRIVARGAKWFRTEGTEKSPGTLVVTVTGSTVRDGVGEVIMGTTLREAIDEIGGGVRPGHTIKAVLSGVSNAFITADQLDTPLTYEDMLAIGSGLGSGGYIVFDDSVDLAAVGAGVSRFLAVESCGQCAPCKRDGLVIADKLAAICRSDAGQADLDEVLDRANTVADRSRCYLAQQHQTVVTSLLTTFGDELRAHLGGGGRPAEPMLIAELVAIEGDQAVVDGDFATKQPDWSHDPTSSGQWPADRFDEHRAHLHPIAE